MEEFSKVFKGCVERNSMYQQMMYEQYRGYAFKTVFRYIHSWEQTTDVVNDGFVKLFSNINKFEPQPGIENEKLFMAWLKKIMINLSIDKLRAQKNIPETNLLDENVWKIPADVCGAAEVLFYNDIIKLVKQLPLVYRTAFNLSVIDGYTHTEIAKMLNIPVSTSRSNLLRARTMLQKSILKLEDNKKCSL